MALRTLAPRVATFDPRKVKPPPKVADAFYLSSEWRRLVDEIIQERGRRCEDVNCRTPRGPWGRIHGDHVHEIRDGGAKLDKRNVMLRCDPCHGRKTARERSTRMARTYTSSVEK
jgi:5-methylcytosine-specific restriction endonuclease McrA